MIKICLIPWVFIILISGCAQENDVRFDDNDFKALNDADKDGVIDSRDTCPETDELLAVTNDGCPIWEEVSKQDELVIFFDISSSKISDTDMDKLADKVAFVQSHEGTSILLEGFTSTTGTKEINEKLQKQRAHAVKEALISLGIQQNKITVHDEGHFSEHVLVDDKHVHSANQRVYIKIIKLDRKAKDKWSIMTNE